jgi:hypothetical protein
MFEQTSTRVVVNQNNGHGGNESTGEPSGMNGGCTAEGMMRKKNPHTTATAAIRTAGRKIQDEAGFGLGSRAASFGTTMFANEKMAEGEPWSGGGVKNSRTIS